MSGRKKTHQTMSLKEMKTHFLFLYSKENFDFPYYNKTLFCNKIEYLNRPSILTVS